MQPNIKLLPSSFNNDNKMLANICTSFFVMMVMVVVAFNHYLVLSSTFCCLFYFIFLSFCHLLFWYSAFVMVSLSFSCACFDYFVWMHSFADCFIHPAVDTHITIICLKPFVCYVYFVCIPQIIFCYLFSSLIIYANCLHAFIKFNWSFWKPWHHHV